MAQQVDSKIEKYLLMKGNKRLQVNDDIVDLTYKAVKDIPGIKLEFIETRKYGGWNEYKMLYKFPKKYDNFYELNEMLRNIQKLISCFVNFYSKDYIKVGLQEVDFNRDSYYFLFYVIKEIGEEEVDEIKEIFKEFEEYEYE